MSRITIHRRGYTRKPFIVRRRGKNVRIGRTTVKPSTFRIRDRGKPGRGPKVVPPLAKGALGGPGFFKRPSREQKQILFTRAKRLGERKVVGELRALQVFFKTTDPKKSRRALALSKQVAGSFRGKQQVRYPEGFRRKQ